jgi:hypothetical protein
VKHFITRAEFSLNRLCELTDAGIVSAPKGNWQGYCHRMERTEEEYYETVIFSDVTDRIVKSNPYKKGFIWILRGCGNVI